MNIIILIIFGALVGWVASLLVGGRKGLLLDIIVGIAGSVIGGWLMGFFDKSGVTGFNVYSFLVALLGAVVLLVIVKAIKH
ncbi:MAG: GlsB/YeaQ/YmgE family stress response membrane protein [Candidatus Gribaldobacteria bacterium]|nr:GlsB/YeaQ/YmgE family stress response membrane protein [Candidatus Gribaldobacteria bacterium]